MSGQKLTILFDTREQHPLAFPPGVEVRPSTLLEADYTAVGLENRARIERKSAADLWGTLGKAHARFDRELARLLLYPQRAIVVDDASSAAEIIERMHGSEDERARFFDVCRSIEWNWCIPIKFCGSRDRAARYIVDVLSKSVEHFDPAKLERAEMIARAAVPYASAAKALQASLLAMSGLCVHCSRRLGVRPKPAGPDVCACGRKKAIK